MAEIYSILLAGLTATEESLAQSHFARSGHLVVAAQDVAEAKEKLKVQKIDLVYMQASAPDRGVNELKEAVLSFSANAPQHDDITMMVLGYRES